MAAAIGKYAANKMLSKEMKKYKDKKVDGGDVSSPTNINNGATTNIPP